MNGIAPLIMGKWYCPVNYGEKFSWGKMIMDFMNLVKIIHENLFCWYQAHVLLVPGTCSTKV